jgi:hypothetical protein
MVLSVHDLTNRDKWIYAQRGACGRSYRLEINHLRKLPCGRHFPPRRLFGSWFLRNKSTLTYSRLFVEVPTAFQEETR